MISLQQWKDNLFIFLPFLLLFSSLVALVRVQHFHILSVSLHTAWKIIIIMWAPSAHLQRRWHYVKEALLSCFFQTYCYLHEAAFLNDFVAKKIEYEIIDRLLYLHTLTSSFTCMKVSENKKNLLRCHVTAKPAGFNIKNLDFQLEWEEYTKCFCPVGR